MTYSVNNRIEQISLIIKHLRDIFRYLDLPAYDFRVACRTGTGERK